MSTELQSSPLAAAVQVRGVSKTYGTAERPVPALREVDLAVAPGSFVSIIGPSGCGKSTLLKLIAGLELPESGSISVFEVSPEQAGAAKLIGLVPQQPALLPWLTVEQNVTLPQRINRRADERRATISCPPLAGRAHQSVDGLLATVGLSDARHRLPRELSGGMQQRTAIVRAFALGPELLLLDEPFSALDEFTRETLQTELLRIWTEHRVTVVFVTHSIAEAVRLSDSVLVMGPGVIADRIEIDLPRPRTDELLSSAEFGAATEVVRDRLRQAWRSVTRPSGE